MANRNPFLLSPQKEIDKVNARAARKSLHPAFSADRYLPHNVFVRATSYDRDAAHQRLVKKMHHAAGRLGPRSMGPGLQSLQNRALAPPDFLYLAKISLDLKLEDDELCEVIMAYGSRREGPSDPHQPATIDGVKFYTTGILKMAKEAKLQLHRRNKRRNELQAKRNRAPQERCEALLMRSKVTRNIDYCFHQRDRASVTAKLATAAMRSGWDKRYAIGLKKVRADSHSRRRVIINTKTLIAPS